jgi:kynurenine formamidase
MRRTAILVAALLGGLAVDWLAVQFETGTSTASEVAGSDKPAPSATLDELCAGHLKIVDLTWPLNSQGAFWPGDNYQPFELRTIATIERNGVLSKAFSMAEHQGTHIDAPNHFAVGRPSVDAIPPADLFAQGVVIDVSHSAAEDGDYRLSLEDIQAWEHRHGQIPRQAVVLLSTGRGQYFMDPPRYRGADDKGRMHFPGFSAAAVQFLLDKREIRGIGIDTLSNDYGLSRDFAVHHLVANAGRYGLENLANLDKLPARGFYLFAAPIKIENGSGGPTRVLAIIP